MLLVDEALPNWSILSFSVPSVNALGRSSFTCSSLIISTLVDTFELLLKLLREGFKLVDSM